MNKLKFEIVDLGVHHPDYFNGFGSSFTSFEHCTYGIGDTTEEAYQQALDSAAQFSPWAEIDLKVMPKHCPFQYSVDDSGHGDESDGPYCHVGIRWNTIKETIGGPDNTGWAP